MATPLADKSLETVSHHLWDRTR